MIHKQGWFSPSSIKEAGTVIWRTPDGSEVECTHVSPGLSHGTQWEDIVSCGPVTRFIRREIDSHKQPIVQSIMEDMS